MLIIVLVVIAGAVTGVSVVALTRRDPRRIAQQSVKTPPQSQALDPAVFATGSCVAFRPTKGDRNVTVVLDAGHGGLDPGAVGITQLGKTIDEASETLPVELDAMALLRADGFRVVVTRTGNSSVVRLTPADVSGSELSLQGAHDDVAARAQCADDAKASALVGIYFDAGGTEQNAGIITAYDADRPFSAANLTLANLVQNDVLARMNAQGWAIPNDGVQTDDTLGSVSGDPYSGGLAAEAADYGHIMLIGPSMPGYFSTPSDMPGVVTEPLYITDPFEGSIADSAVGQQAIAQGIATAVEQFLPPPPPPVAKAPQAKESKAAS